MRVSTSLKHLLGFVPCVFLFALNHPAALSQATGNANFGGLFNAKALTLQRKLPPVYNLSGKTVSVHVLNTDTSSVADELQSAIENQLTGSDSTVHARETSPDVLIECKVTSYNSPKVETSTSGSVTSSEVVGGLIVSFKITLPSTSALIASNIASSEVIQPFQPFQSNSPSGLSALHLGPSKKMTPIEAEKTLVTEVATQIAAFLVKTTETVPVKLAVGKSLNQANDLAVKLLWTRDLEELNTVGAYADPSVDAYRLYDMGVANEALAYQAQDITAAIKYLQQASIYYGKATDAKPDEKYFLDPQNRIRTALAHYSTETAPPPPPTEAEVKEAQGIMTNDDVIEMVQAKMDDANILDNIQSAPQVEFDLTTNGQVKLAKDGVSGKIITAMKQKAHGTVAKPKTAK
jgi:hypothetical protein